MKRPLDKAPPPAFGSIVAGEIVLVRELCRRLNWERKTLSHAKQEGLITIRFGRSDYVRGDDVLAFFGKLAEQQAGGNGTEAAR
jgi:hypothetical protein